jgi:predicted MFS family arabinose efflux permease
MLRHGHQPELGLHFSGLGMGIALSAAFAIFMTGDYNWAQQWYVFTIAGALLAIPAWLWLPKPNANGALQSAKTLVDKPPNRNWMLILYAAYFCAGFGYVISATFLVTIVDQQETLQGNGNLVWLVTGIAASPACIIWDRVARKIGELHALMIAFGLNIIGILIPAIPGFGESLTGVLISGLFFGATFIGIVSLMLTMVGKFYPTKPAKPMGKLTLSYGAAQILAPALSGTIAESTGNYNMPLILASMIMSFGIVLLVVLKFRQKY